MNNKLQIAVAFAVILLLQACNDESKTTNTSPVADSTTTKEAQAASLFNGTNLEGWHTFNKKEEIKNWRVEDGALVCLGAVKGASGSGDIVTDKEFGDFELSWDWKVDKGSNSGVMYHVIEDPKYKAPYETGPEYQIIDDTGFSAKLENWQKAGADYAMNTPNEKKKLNAVGQWNSSKIIVNKGHVEHWLNGEKIIDFQVGSDTWNKGKAEGKWKDYPDYGKASKGKIALQDHGNKAYFKNIVIKEL